MTRLRNFSDKTRSIHDPWGKRTEPSLRRPSIKRSHSDKIETKCCHKPIHLNILLTPSPSLHLLSLSTSLLVSMSVCFFLSISISLYLSISLLIALSFILFSSCSFSSSSTFLFVRFYIFPLIYISIYIYIYIYICVCVFCVCLSIICLSMHLYQNPLLISVFTIQLSSAVKLLEEHYEFSHFALLTLAISSLTFLKDVSECFCYVCMRKRFEYRSQHFHFEFWE